MGVYGYMLGGLGYALLGSSRHLAIGPTSAISLMVAASVGAMAGGDAARYAEIASLAAFAVALLCLIAWALRLSVLVKLISDSILVGFKAGAGITIAMTQLPALFGVPGGGHNVIERVVMLAGQLPGLSLPTLARRAASPSCCWSSGGRLLPGRPVALGVVVLSILAAALLGLAGARRDGHRADPRRACRRSACPSLRLSDVEGIFPLAAGCLLLAYIEGVSAARSFAEKHGYALNPRQEFLGIGAANLMAGLGHGYPVAGGLSQSAVAEKAGARTPLTLVFASATLALCLLFLTGLLANLPKATLAAVVLTAVAGLIDIPALLRLWRVSRADFAAAAVALAGVLLLGILQGILLAALASVLIMLVRASRPHVAFLGRVPGTHALQRHGAPPGERAHPRRARLPPGRIAALRQRRGRAGGGPRAAGGAAAGLDAAGGLRPFRLAVYGPRRPSAMLRKLHADAGARRASGLPWPGRMAACATCCAATASRSWSAAWSACRPLKPCWRKMRGPAPVLRAEPGFGSRRTAARTVIGPARDGFANRGADRHRQRAAAPAQQ